MTTAEHTNAKPTRAESEGTARTLDVSEREGIESVSEELEGAEEADNEETTHQRKCRRRRKLLIGICLAAVILFVIVDSCTSKYLKIAIEKLLKWVEENPVAGIVAFTLFVFVATGKKHENRCVGFCSRR
jgi:pheromone shutdown protein TraB